jgi:8-oxo-dGTP pyrophosphatase MutT (NUDIX family)
VEAVRPGGHEGVGLSREVRAAGGVVWRRGEGGIEVLLIHRPRYGDWSFPKGKVKGSEGESDEAAAVREVDEEVGIVASLGPELESTTYRDVKGRKKTVRYWAMELPPGASPTEGDGVDEWRWVPLAAAPDRLSWGRDRAVLASLPVEELV